LWALGGSGAGRHWPVQSLSGGLSGSSNDLDSVYSSACHRLIQVIKFVTAIPGPGKWGKYLQNTRLSEERQALLTRRISGSNML
jgi:hypothetical protein